MGKPGEALSRFGLLWGISALTALLVAFVSGSWLYTDEPISLPNSTRLSFSIGITVGLWTVCPYVKKINTTIHFTSPTCSLVKYKKWDYDFSDFEVSGALDLAQLIVSRIRSCTLLCGTAIILIITAVILAVLGYINNDRKIVIACGVFILGGLSIGTSLVIFVTYLTETLIEVSHTDKGLHFVYHYGWCFYLASTAFLLTNAAGLFSIMGYMNTFSNVDEMVKQMVPGGKRKLQQYPYKSTLVKHEYQQYDLLSSSRLKMESDYGAVTTDTPPDVCSTSHCPLPTKGDYSLSTLPEEGFNEGPILAGQTVPITIKSQSTSMGFSSLPVTKYETVCQGYCEVAEIEEPACSTYYDEDYTGQGPQKGKGILNFSNKRPNTHSFGSAV
ncbi:voltage-dependent calcium channel gamma-7 subunit-like [Anoplophora glabripennis]|uniref:voltage-dependent calcium channel gamma-7 subunit-like n=1 Tax=Anoplophora glabripennis TaxID=217634 RepID=UPI000873AC90|nr:voltage-dependent calcium channel gamma-7 subunit-like [Anoplophora glabripennis]